MKITADTTAAALATREDNAQNEQLLQVAQGFESILVNQMLSVMRSTVVKDGIVPQSHAEKVFEGMMDSEYAKRLSETGQFGLADMVYQHLLRTMPTK